MLNGANSPEECDQGVPNKGPEGTKPITEVKRSQRNREEEQIRAAFLSSREEGGDSQNAQVGQHRNQAKKPPWPRNCDQGGAAQCED